jgi:hypothetical protein
MPGHLTIIGRSCDNNSLAKQKPRETRLVLHVSYHAGAGVEESLYGLQGDLHSQPETGNYTFKQVMQAQNTTYEIDLCPSQLKQVLLASPPHDMSVNSPLLTRLSI